MAACSNVQSTTKRGGLIENTDFFDSIDPRRTQSDRLRSAAQSAPQQRDGVHPAGAPDARATT